jgi:mono/diheme cytochrome c family protein
MRAIAIVLFGALAAAPAAAQEKPVTLKPGPGLDQVEANCGACHSLDYIQMNSPFLTAAMWDAEVAKMINAFGAPISEADARAIGDYLKANYGADHVTENR